MLSRTERKDALSRGYAPLKPKRASGLPGGSHVRPSRYFETVETVFTHAGYRRRKTVPEILHGQRPPDLTLPIEYFILPRRSLRRPPALNLTDTAHLRTLSHGPPRDRGAMPLSSS